MEMVDLRRSAWVILLPEYTSVNHVGGCGWASALEDALGHLSVSSAPLHAFPLFLFMNNLVPGT